jgi:hypothetical protein
MMTDMEKYPSAAQGTDQSQEAERRAYGFGSYNYPTSVRRRMNNYVEDEMPRSVRLPFGRLGLLCGARDFQ